MISELTNLLKIPVAEVEKERNFLISHDPERPEDQSQIKLLI